MSICGIEIKGSEAIFAIASLQGDALQHVAKFAPDSLLVPPYDDALVMAGQGTLALEMSHSAFS